MSSRRGFLNWLGLVKDATYDYDQAEFDVRYEQQDAADFDGGPSYAEPAEVTDIAAVRDRRARASTSGPAHAEIEPEVNVQIPSVLHAIDYGSMAEIGEEFRSGRAVIMDLAWVADKAVRRQMVDFSAGMVYALSGREERLEKNVFLLVPAGVEVDQAGVAQAGMTRRSA